MFTYKSEGHFPPLQAQGQRKHPQELVLGIFMAENNSRQSLQRQGARKSRGPLFCSSPWSYGRSSNAERTPDCRQTAALGGGGFVPQVKAAHFCPAGRGCHCLGSYSRSVGPCLKGTMNLSACGLGMLPQGLCVSASSWISVAMDVACWNQLQNPSCHRDPLSGLEAIRLQAARGSL